MAWTSLHLRPALHLYCIYINIFRYISAIAQYDKMLERSQQRLFSRSLTVLVTEVTRERAYAFSAAGDKVMV